MQYIGNAAVDQNAKAWLKSGQRLTKATKHNSPQMLENSSTMSENPQSIMGFIVTGFTALQIKSLSLITADQC